MPELTSLPVFRCWLSLKPPEPVHPSALMPTQSCACAAIRRLYRGTGGALHDRVRASNDRTGAGRMPHTVHWTPLVLAAAPAASRRRLLISHQDGRRGVPADPCKLAGHSPTGSSILRAALPRIAPQFCVKVMHCRRPTGCRSDRCRITSSCCAAIPHPLALAVVIDPLRKTPRLAIVEDAAHVDPRLRTCHYSVGFARRVVEAARRWCGCVVCPGGFVRQKTTVVDKFVRASL